MLINLAQTIANNIIHAASLMTAEGNPRRNAGEVDRNRRNVVSLFRCVLPESRASVAATAEATAMEAFDDDPPGADAARDFLASCVEIPLPDVDKRGAEPLRNTAGRIVRWQCRVCGLVASSQEFAAACCNRQCDCGAFLNKSVWTLCPPCLERHREEQRAAWMAEQEHVSPEEWGGPVFWEDNSSHDIDEAAETIFDHQWGDEPASAPDYFECAHYRRLDARVGDEEISDWIIERIAERFDLPEGYSDWHGWRIDLLKEGLATWLKTCEVQWSEAVKGKIILGEAFDAYARKHRRDLFEEDPG